jgi:hypothetical protein
MLNIMTFIQIFITIFLRQISYLLRAWSVDNASISHTSFSVEINHVTNNSQRSKSGSIMQTISLWILLQCFFWWHQNKFDGQMWRECGPWGSIKILNLILLVKNDAKIPKWKWRMKLDVDHLVVVFAKLLRWFPSEIFINFRKKVNIHVLLHDQS